MSDKAYIVVKGAGSKVYLYSNNKGYLLPLILKNALIRGQKDRWNDTQYLSRIIFCEMIKDDVLGTTGYGISSVIFDNEHTTIDVDVDKQTVHISGKPVSFSSYVNTSDRSLPDII